jgi:hypothetical protein
MASVAAGVAAVGVGTRRGEATAGEPIVAGEITSAGQKQTELRAGAPGKDTLRVVNRARGHAIRAIGGRGGVVGASEGGVGVSGIGMKGVQAIGRDQADEPGIGLEVRGRSLFSSVSQVVVRAGSTSATVSSQRVSARSLVLATAQGDAGDLSVSAKVVPPGEIRVHLSAEAPAGGLRVALFVTEPTFNR